MPEPTGDAPQTVLRKIITRRGVLVEEEGSTCVADTDTDTDTDTDSDSGEAHTLRPLRAAACTCRIASGPRAGQKVPALQGAMRRETDFKQTLRCAAAPTTARRWNNRAAPSPARRWPMSAVKKAA